jgi:hypothetical protein
MGVYACDLKTLGLCWLRFGKQYSFVATEAGYWSADVLGTNGKQVIEIETKISKHDLKADIKKHKHYHYKCAKFQSPNRFFFLVPENLAEEAAAQAESINPAYGVLTTTLDFPRYGYHMHKTVKCFKKAKHIHQKPPDPKFLLYIAKRMSSELCGYHINSGWQRSFLDHIKALNTIPDIDALEESPTTP